MEFDLLVRKYLRGTLSSTELDHLRDLLERVPEYRTELRQILELRSIIHDDALRLMPPRDLSDGTRESVGARFAGLESLLQRDAMRISTPGLLADDTRSAVGRLFAASAPATDVSTEIAEEEQEPRRRAVILPYRIAGRVLLAASLAVAVAVAPTALTPTLDGDARPVAGNAIARLDASDDFGGDDRGSVPATATDAVTGAGADRGTARATTQYRSAHGRTRDAVPVAIAASAVDPNRAAHAQTASVDNGGQQPPVASSIDAGSTVIIDKDNPLSSMLPRSAGFGGLHGAYHPASDSLLRRPEPRAAEAIAGLMVASIADDSRFMTVGVTLGSGNVIDADAPAALMQNSYYFAFSVSSDDRIGVEMGGSTFMQETQVANKRPTGNIFAKQGAGDSSSGSSMLGGGVAPTTSAQRMKQDITYGGVFYDRRMEVDRSWDLCVRTTFGAADGALVTGVRAYTAYSPTKNVTLTLGIGGSKLFSLSGSSKDESTNYGLYYGVETGF